MEFEQQMLSSICNSLEVESKSSRKGSLLRLRKETLEKIVNADDALRIFDQIYKPVIKSFNDPSEACREIAINLIIDFISIIPTPEPYLTYIITVLVKRLGGEEILESSEEIRLLFINLLRKIISKCGISLVPYYHDITIILTKGLVDQFPKVKIESCECTYELTEAIPKQFHVQSESFVKPLLQGVTHKHNKVRSTSIITLGMVVQRGTQGLVEQVTVPLAERLNDSSSTVRCAVITTAGLWMRELPDRYSHFARILPLILTGLQDELSEVRENANCQWQLAGLQFIKENEDEFKEKMDFAEENLPHYPSDIVRPLLGCRALVQRSASKLLPAVLAELHDWSIAVRLQAATLLYQLVLHLEGNSTQFAAKIWPDLTLICGPNCDEPRLIEKVLHTSELIGFFVPVQTVLSISLSQDQLTLGQLRCLANAIKGLPGLAEPELGNLVSALANTRSANVQPEYFAALLDCVAASLLVVQGKCSDSTILSLFMVLLSLQGIGDSNTTDEAKRLLNDLAVVSGVKTAQLYNIHAADLLTSLKPSISTWTGHSPEKNTFLAFVLGADSAIGEHLSAVAEILVTWAKHLKNAKSLTDFLRISQTLLSWNFLASCNSDPGPFLSTVLQEAIIPNLSWSAGRVAETRRSQALICLLLAVTDPEIPTAVVSPLCPNLLPLLMGLLEETSKEMRLNACQCCCALLPRWSEHFTLEDVFKSCHVLSKRLDDTNSEVRLRALETIKSLLLSLPPEHSALSSTNHLEDLYKVMLIHLDDTDPIYQEEILGSLKQIGHIETSSLITLLKKAKKNFRNQDACNELEQHLEELRGK